MKSLKAKTLSFFFALVVLFSTSADIFAAGSCTMESGPSPELNEYLTKLSTSLGNLKNAGAGGSCGAVTSANGNSATQSTHSLVQDVTGAAASILRGTNLALNQDCYVGASSFTTELGLKSEVPVALRQQLNLLIKKSEEINLAIEQVYRTCSQTTEVESASIIEGYTDPAKEQLSKLGESLLQNHTSIICAYRNAALGRPPEQTSFLLAGPGFIEKLSKSYGPEAQQTCRKEGDVFKQVKEGLEKLGNTSKNIKEKMAIWQTSDKATESPHEVEMRKNKETELAPKLKNSGLLSDISTADIRSQANYMMKDANEGVSGFLGNLGAQAVSTFEKMKSFYTFAPKVEDAKNTDDWVKRYENISTLQTDVGKEVLAKYNGLMGQIGDEQLSKDIYEGKLGRIYIELESGTKLLEPYRKVAQKICDKDQTTNVDGTGCLPK